MSEWWIPARSLAHNIYNNPQAAVGPPNAGGFGPGVYTGFVSLGFGGHVTVDLGGCVTDVPGNDLRIYQAVSSEPLSVYVSTSPEGPFTLLQPRKDCGTRVNAVQGYCDFDLASAAVARPATSGSRTASSSLALRHGAARAPTSTRSRRSASRRARCDSAPR